MIVSLENLLNEIISHGNSIIISKYTNFNIVLAYKLYEEAFRRGFKPCLQILDSYALYYAKRVCGEIGSYENQCDISIIIANTYSLCLPYKTNSNRVICIVSSFSHRTHNKLSSYNMYKVSNVKENIYRISNLGSGDREKVFSIAEVRMCNLLNYEIPQNVLMICNELRSLASLAGSVKASDFLRYLTRVKGVQREEALEAIRLAISLGLIKYNNGYLMYIESL